MLSYAFLSITIFYITVWCSTALLCLNSSISEYVEIDSICKVMSMFTCMCLYETYTYIYIYRQIIYIYIYVYTYTHAIHIHICRHTCIRRYIYTFIFNLYFSRLKDSILQCFSIEYSIISCDVITTSMIVVILLSAMKPVMY